MRRQCEALKNNVKCLLDPINILNSSSSLVSDIPALAALDGKTANLFYSVPTILPFTGKH